MYSLKLTIQSVVTIWLALLLILVAMPLDLQPATAQGGPFRILLIDLDASDPDRVEVRTRQDHLTARVNGVACASTDATGETPVILVGLSNQPAECRTEGSIVTLWNAAGLQLSETFVLRLGETARLGNYAPVPGETGHGALEVGRSSGSKNSQTAALLAVAVAAALTGRLLAKHRRIG
jgi:hypothetical protein